MIRLFSFSLFALSTFFLSSCSQSANFSSSKNTTGSSSPIVSVVKNTGENTYTHIVKHKGESLSNIAAWYTGRTANWRKLAEFNSMKSPYTIELGQAILIPSRMLTRFTSLPKEMIVRPKTKKIFASKKKAMSTKLKSVETKKSGAIAEPIKRASLKIKNDFEVKPIETTTLKNSVESNVVKSNTAKLGEKLELEEEMSKLESSKSLNFLDRFKKVLKKPLFNGK